ERIQHIVRFVRVPDDADELTVRIDDVQSDENLRRRSAEGDAVDDRAHEPSAEPHAAPGAFPEDEGVRLFPGDVADLHAVAVNDRHPDERTTPPRRQSRHLRVCPRGMAQTAARTTPEIAKRALAAARKDLVASSRDPDPSFARSLLERAEQTEAAGDLGRALDLARAARRVLEIARRKARVADALAYADAVLDGAKKAGIETLAFQRNIDQARALVAGGDFIAAERLLRRVSIR